MRRLLFLRAVILAEIVCDHAALGRTPHIESRTHISSKNRSMIATIRRLRLSGPYSRELLAGSDSYHPSMNAHTAVSYGSHGGRSSDIRVPIICAITPLPRSADLRIASQSEGYEKRLRPFHIVRHNSAILKLGASRCHTSEEVHIYL